MPSLPQFGSETGSQVGHFRIALERFIHARAKDPEVL